VNDHQDDAPWKQRFRAPIIVQASVAPEAPERGLVVTNPSGICQLYAWDVPNGTLVQRTDRPEGQVSGTLSPDGRYIYYLDDRQGNEIGHFVRVPFAGGVPEDVTPDLPPYSTPGLFCSRKGTMLGLTARTAGGAVAYCLAVEPDGALGPLRVLHHGPATIIGPIFSADGAVAVVMSNARTRRPQYSVLAFDTATGALLGELWDGPDSSVTAGLFSPLAGDHRLVVLSNRSGANRPLLWHARTGEREELLLGDVDGDVEAWDWSADGRRLLLCQTHRAIQQLYLYDLARGSAVPLPHPGGRYGAAYFAPDATLHALWEDAAHPPQLIALDGQRSEPAAILLRAGEVPPGKAWRSVTFPSSDGQQVQGWLALPTGAGPFPTILETHGGPAFAATASFSPQAQAWLDHGYAFLTINYRGSTTFGKRFEEKIWGDLGHWEVEDMVAARAWLVRQGIARPAAVVLTGWSYGGYLTLQALGTYPELWAGGMAGVAVADRAAQFAEVSDQHRAWLTALFGGTPQEKPQQYAASSPITHAERVQAPILVIQGYNDSRCPAGQMARYEARMKSLGKPIEVLWFDAGHAGSFAQVELSIAYQEAMLRFAGRIVASLPG
jgi:dipeptidyl aminopeptidase/acylaminoacyl peptidase